MWETYIRDGKFLPLLYANALESTTTVIQNDKALCSQCTTDSVVDECLPVRGRVVRIEANDAFQSTIVLRMSQSYTYLCWAVMCEWPGNLLGLVRYGRTTGTWRAWGTDG